MWKFKRPVLSILSALLICALLMVSFPVLDTLINPEGSDSENSMVYAQDDPCEGCSGAYNAMVAAENVMEDSPDDTLDEAVTAYMLAKYKYEACLALGCDTDELKAYFNYKPTGGMTISFNASGSTGNIERYCWTFGDRGDYIDGGKLYYHAIKGVPTVQHTYSEAGTYVVILTVDSGEGTKSSQYRLEISVGQDILQITSITRPKKLVYDVESRWELQFKGTCENDYRTEIRFEVFDQNKTRLGSYGKHEVHLSGLASGGWSFDISIPADILIPSGTTELTFKAYILVFEIDIAFTEKVYPFETLELVKFSCDAPQPAKLDEFYEVTVEVVDREENNPWTYMFNTSAGEFLDVGGWLTPHSQPHRPYLQRDSKNAKITWKSPTSASNLELQYAKNMIQVTKDLARNLSATGSSTVPIVGRVVKGVNDMYNIIDGMKTAGGHAGKSYEAMTRGELLRAVMYAANATVEGIQVTVGGVLLIPKAVLPAGVKEAANILTDTANASIDYIQVSCETLTEAFAEGGKASRVIWVHLLVKVTNNETASCGRYIIVELKY